MLDVEPSVQSVSRVVERRLLPLFLAGEVLMQIDRSNISFAATTLEAKLGLTSELFGLAAGIFFVGYALFEVPSNLMLQRVAPNRWLGGMLIGWALVTTSQAFAPNAGFLVFIRFVLGVFEGGFLPGVIFLVALWLPRDSRTRASAVVNSAAPLGAIIGGPFAGWLLQNRLGNLAGWQTLFLVEGLLTLAYGVVFIALVPRGPQQARWLSGPGRDVFLRALAADEAPEAGRYRSSRSFMAAITSRPVWIYAVAYLLLAAGFYGIQFWLPQILKTGFPNVSSLETGVLSAVPFVCALAVIATVGRTSQRTGDGRWHLVALGLLAAVTLVLSVAFRSPVFDFVTLCVAVSCALAYIPVFWASPMTMLPAVAAAGGIAVINSIGNVGGFVGPYIAGLLKGHGGSFGPAIAFFALALAASGVVPLIARSRFWEAGRFAPAAGGDGSLLASLPAGTRVPEQAAQPLDGAGDAQRPRAADLSVPDSRTQQEGAQ